MQGGTSIATIESSSTLIVRIPELRN